MPESSNTASTQWQPPNDRLPAPKEDFNLTSQEKKRIYNRERDASMTDVQKTKRNEGSKLAYHKRKEKLRNDAVHDPTAAEKLAKRKEQLRLAKQKSRQKKTNQMTLAEEAGDDQERENGGAAEGRVEEEAGSEAEEEAEGEAEGKAEGEAVGKAEGEAEGAAGREAEEVTQQTRRGRSFWDII